MKLLQHVPIFVVLALFAVAAGCESQFIADDCENRQGTECVYDD